MQAELRALLKANAGLIAIVGDRIEWDVHQQGGTRPYIVLFLISGVPDYHMAGPSGLVESRVQVDCYGKTKADAHAAAAAVEALLSGLTVTQGGIRFQGIFKEGGGTGFEKPANSSEGLYRERADYQVVSGLAA